MVSSGTHLGEVGVVHLPDGLGGELGDGELREEHAGEDSRTLLVLLLLFLHSRLLHLLVMLMVLVSCVRLLLRLRLLLLVEFLGSGGLVDRLLLLGVRLWRRGDGFPLLGGFGGLGGAHGGCGGDGKGRLDF